VTKEGRFHNADWGDARYCIENVHTGAKAWIFPARLEPDHGVVGPDAFSNVDVYVRKYRAEEDRPWPLRPEQDMGFAVHEPLSSDDIVFWSVSHLSHHADEGADHWHSIGPTIVFDLPEPAVPGPADETHRRVRVQGTIRIKDYRLIGANKTGSESFDKTVLLSPTASHAEIAISSKQVGDVTAVLRIRVDRNRDNSVFVGFDARLFDEKDVVASAGKEFNVLKDASLHWQGVQLVDHHAGDPDTSDIDFTVTNDMA
jgi:hypothetical protein